MTTMTASFVCQDARGEKREKNLWRSGGSTPTLSASLGSTLLHIVAVSARDMCVRPPKRLSFCSPPVRLSGCLHSQLSHTPPLPPGERCDKTRRRRVAEGGKRENEATPPPSCHSLTARLTIMACHHFLIRPVSKKRCNKTAVRHPPYLHCPPSPPHTHTHPQISRVVLFVGARGSHPDMQKKKKKDIKHVKKVLRYRTWE